MPNKNSFKQLAIPAVTSLSPYQPGKPIDELERELGLKDIIKLASNENPLGPSSKVQEAVNAAIEETALYPDGNGFHLKQALSEKLGVSTETITLGNGSNDVLDLVARVFLNAGREAVYSEYAFIVYSIATQSVGATARVATALSQDSEQPYGHDLAAMAALVNEKTSVVFIANPNNPTGTWLRKDQLKAFLDGMPKHVIIVLDEAYGEYITESEYPNALEWLASYPNLIITRTFSKAYGLAGLRIGYSISHPDIADLLNRVRMPFNVNSLGLVAAHAALSDEAYIAESCRLNKQGLQQLSAGFEALGLSYIPSVGNFLAVDVGKSGNEVFQQLLREGIIVRPLAEYGMPNYVRITIGTPLQIERVIFALKKVLKK